MEARTPCSRRSPRPRYPSDLADVEWALVSPLIQPARRGGRKRSVDVREVLNAIFYVLATGCQWKALPKDLPPKSTAHFYFMLWDWDGTLERIHDALYVAIRQVRRPRGQPHRRDHQLPIRQGGSKRGSAIDPQGFDAGKKVTGRKRHILVDTLGLLLGVSILPANIQDRDGVARLAARCAATLPVSSRSILRRCRIPGTENGELVAAPGGWKIEIVKRSDRPSLRRLAKALDRRAHLRVDQSQPSSGPRFRTLRDNRRRLRPPRHDPSHAKATNKSNPLNKSQVF